MDSETTNNLVLEVLQRASSQDPEVLKPAEAKLKEWETQPGFYNALFIYLSNPNLDVNVRWIAVLYLKNGIERYWRKNAPGAISEDEKESIRQGLLLTFNEPVSQIALQRAVIIAKIARTDFPKEWNRLFPTLLQAIESPDNLVQHRALLTLHHVIKIVSQKRLPGDRRTFQELTSNIYVFILNLWNNFTESFVANVVQGTNVETITINIEKALLCLRILRKLTVYGFAKPHLNPDCMSFMKVIFEKAKTVLQCRKQLKDKAGYVLETCEKFIIHLTKVLLSLLDIHPFSFIDLIQPSLEFSVYYLFTNDGVQFLFERFVVQCFNMIKNILVCVEYRAAKNPEMTKHPDTLRAYQIKQAFFQPQVLTEMCRKLITHYFILTQEELTVWDSDPEAFSNDETGDSWKYSLRPSMETVFVTVFHEFCSTLTPIILELISETSAIVSPDDMQGILKKDAVYNAVGLCAFDLYDEIDFDQWFTNTLLQELKMKHNNYRVIRRRVSSLIGRWTGIKLSSELRPALYECVIDLLGSEEDMAVRITAASTLRYAIDDFDFNCDQFKDYLFSTFNLLFNLLREATECDTKMQILGVITLMLERMGNTVTPHSEALIQYLPHLWEESEDHNMLRCAIVATLVQIVKAMGVVKEELKPFLLPIIQLGTDTNQSAIVYLLEDSLDLWLTVLEYSPTMTNELMQLFNNMPSLLEYSSENLRQCLLICLVHLLLSPELVMRTHGLQIVTVCGNLISDLGNEGITVVLGLIESFIRAVPALGTETVMPILPKIFQKIHTGEEYPLTMSMYLATMARVLLVSHEAFTRVIINLAQTRGENDQITLSRILDVWLRKMPNVALMDTRKLLGLALANLLTTQSRPVLERIPLIMVQLLETLNDITKEDEHGFLIDSLVLTEGDSPSRFDDNEGYYETDHDHRKKQLILSDPVHNIVLKDYLQSQLYELRNQIGLQQYQQILEMVDSDTITQLKDFVTF